MPFCGSSNQFPEGQPDATLGFVMPYPVEVDAAMVQTVGTNE